MKAEILSNVFLKDKRLLIELAVPSIFKTAVPGQFLHIRTVDSCDPFLRRPLSIHDISHKSHVTSHKLKERVILKIIYEVKGKGTQLLSQKKPLSELDVLGPLGNGFDLRPFVSRPLVFLVAGGMGVAPLFFLAKKIAEIRNSKSEIRIKVLIGAKTKNHILCEKEFKDLGCDLHIATDDGSRGLKGRVTELLKDVLLQVTGSRQQGIEEKEYQKHNSVRCYLNPEPCIYACGPKPMLAAVSEIARTHNLQAQVSLEEFMGCGLGACLGCVIRTTSGYRRVCHDGPVFDAQEIIWKE